MCEYVASLFRDIYIGIYSLYVVRAVTIPKTPMIFFCRLHWLGLDVFGSFLTYDTSWTILWKHERKRLGYRQTHSKWIFGVSVAVAYLTHMQCTCVYERRLPELGVGVVWFVDSADRMPKLMTWMVMRRELLNIFFCLYWVCAYTYNNIRQFLYCRMLDMARKSSNSCCLGNFAQCANYSRNFDFFFFNI